MTITMTTATKAQLREWLDDTTGELASSIAHCKWLKGELRAARKALREVIGKFPRAYPGPCEFHATIDVTSEPLARWTNVANVKGCRSRPSNPTGQGRADCGAYPGPGCSVSELDVK